jgi:NADH-quinone oxidoreductase subunit C
VTSDSSSDITPTGTAVVDDYAVSAADAIGGLIEPAVDTIKISVPRDRWVEAMTAARDDLGLIFFSWLAGVDWANEVVVGDPLTEPVEERYEILCTVGDLVEGRRITVSTTLPKDDAVIDTLVGVYAGANWHEREAYEMFGIDFRGHPDLENLYLPDAFIGNPLRKSYRLLSREVKPWPGKVDVEGMPGSDDDGDAASDGPSTTNPEA